MAHAGPDVYWSVYGIGGKEGPDGYRNQTMEDPPLHYAAWEGCLDQVKAMLEHGVPANC
ncbi:hypothetical protein M9458_037136, partial [Cirrhinus mrigala]